MAGFANIVQKTSGEEIRKKMKEATAKVQAERVKEATKAKAATEKKEPEATVVKVFSILSLIGIERGMLYNSQGCFWQPGYHPNKSGRFGRQASCGGEGR